MSASIALIILAFYFGNAYLGTPGIILLTLSFLMKSNQSFEKEVYVFQYLYVGSNINRY